MSVNSTACCHSLWKLWQIENVGTKSVYAEMNKEGKQSEPVLKQPLDIEGI